jgi:chromosome segregation ATPase
MSERLDRIESMLSASVEAGRRTDERLDRVSARLESVSTKLDSVSTKLDSVSTKLESVAAQQEKNTSDIDTLVGAAATFSSDCEALGRKIDESNQRFDTLRAENIADRAEYRRRSEETNARIEANRAEYRRQNEETNARIDATLGRIDAQQEVIQRLLAELIQTNRDASRLRDRVDTLEQAS